MHRAVALRGALGGWWRLWSVGTLEGGLRLGGGLGERVVVGGAKPEAKKIDILLGRLRAVEADEGEPHACGWL